MHFSSSEPADYVSIYRIILVRVSINLVPERAAAWWFYVYLESTCVLGSKYFLIYMNVSQYFDEPYIHTPFAVLVPSIVLIYLLRHGTQLDLLFAMTRPEF
jgi:hypothetical protein